MDWQWIVNLVVAVGFPAAGWLVKRQGAVESELAAFRLKVAEEYVRHAHLDEIKDALVRIEALLHTKADKRPYREGN